LFGLLVIGGFVLAPSQLAGSTMLPGLQDRDLMVRVQTMPGTSLSEINRITSAASRDLRAVPGVSTVAVNSGRAVGSDQVVNVNSAVLWVSVAPSADLAATKATIQTILNGYPGVGHTLSNYTDDRLATAGAGPTSPVVVRVFGPDLSVLRAQAEQVRGVLASVDGIRDARAEVLPMEPSLQVEVDLAKAQKYGIRPGDVRRAAATMLAGLPAGNLYEQQKIFDVVVWGAESARHSVATVANLAIDTASGGTVPLHDVATVKVAPYPTVITHHDVSRSLDVTAQVSGRDVGAVQQQVKSRIQAMSFPLEYRAEVSAASTDTAQPSSAMLASMLVAAIAILLVLQAATSSWRMGLILMVTLPVSVVGGLVTGAFVGGVGTLGGLIGLVAVLGLAARGNLLLVRRLQRDQAAGDGVHRDLVLAGTREQATSLVLTALATGAAVLPFALAGDIPGAEILHPMAVVIIGALVTCVAISLLVLPALYLRFASNRWQTAAAGLAFETRAAFETHAEGGPGPS
jgi:Cu/Ag efflux pump CusA